ncbi:MAG TPA: ClpXP protease specificity-enhancing factor [Gammaproteobacteria bacterium]|jgi:stringent starvation protein B
MAGPRKTKQRPYLIRAMHEWMVDNGLTPHIVADATVNGLKVPSAHIKEGKIVLNVSHSATHGLVLGNDEIAFEARFDGVAQLVSVPVQAVLGIYARETGQGMVFAAEDSPGPPGDGPPAAASRPTLKVVK